MRNKIVRLLHTFAARLSLLFSTRQGRRDSWPPAKKLSHPHIKNCKVLEDRTKILDEIPKHGVCAEIGIWKCGFSKMIAKKAKPATLHLVDIDRRSIDIARQTFAREIKNRVIDVHLQDSSSMLYSMPNHTFDWIYIDGDHSYEGVKKDLQAAHQALKPGGLITLNDYIFFGSSDLTKYGVIEATNEFCIKNNYELIHLALHGRSYNDVTIRKMGFGV